MALPREPRQKMINMMYLVLTALLALNVSSEILNAFKTVNSTLEKSNTTISNSTGSVMTSLEQKTHDPASAEKANIWYPKAQQVQQIAANVSNYIQKLKDDIYTKAGGSLTDPNKRYKDDNLDIATRMMVDKGEGKKLFNMLQDFKKNVLNVDPAINAQFQNSLPIDLSMPKTESKSNRTWEEAYFHMVPTVAALTILSKFQNDVKTSENKVVTFCHEQVGKVEVRQDAFAAIAIANTTNALPNQEIEITAGVGGFSKAVSPTVSINGQNVSLGDDGAAHLKLNAGAVGDHNIPVKITYTDENKKVITIDKTIQYTVGQSNAAVQLDKLNVLFIGVDNPITISGSGDVQRLQISASGGGAVLSGTGANRTIRVTEQTNDCIISVRTPDGKITPVKFRVYPIPDPTPVVGGGDPSMPAREFLVQPGVRAFVPNFFYETQFNVTSFHIVGDGEGFNEGAEEAFNTGATWNEARKIISKVKPGSFITIDNIHAVGPEGRNRLLKVALSYSLK